MFIGLKISRNMSFPGAPPRCGLGPQCCQLAVVIRERVLPSILPCVQPHSFRQENRPERTLHKVRLSVWMSCFKMHVVMQLNFPNGSFQKIPSTAEEIPGQVHLRTVDRSEISARSSWMSDWRRLSKTSG